MCAGHPYCQCVTLDVFFLVHSQYILSIFSVLLSVLQLAYLPVGVVHMLDMQITSVDCSRAAVLRCRASTLSSLDVCKYLQVLDILLSLIWQCA